MKYYYDFEFLEGKQDKRFLGIKYGETKPTVDVISVGLVSSDNREYYAISKDFNLYEAWNRFDLKKEYPDDTEEGSYTRKIYWIRNNILRPILEELLDKEYNETSQYEDHKPIYSPELYSYKELKRLLNKYGKTNNQIAIEIKDFCYKDHDFYDALAILNIQLYGYYSDYDHVALCQLFGKMIDLPNGFPMYTFDLKQESDRIYNLKKEEYKNNGGKNFINKLSNHPNYPKQINEHNALEDAKFNKQLNEFLNNLNG